MSKVKIDTKKMTLEDIQNKLIYVSLSDQQKDYIVNLITMAHEVGYLEGMKSNYNKYLEVYGG